MARMAGSQWRDSPSTTSATPMAAVPSTTRVEKLIRLRSAGSRKPAQTAPVPMAASISPKASGPRPSWRRTSSGSSPQIAAPAKKVTSERRMVPRSAGLATTKRTPVRMADRKCSLGRRPAGACRRHRNSATTSTSTQAAFRAKVACGPATPISSPPNAGPRARARLKPMPFSTMAWARSARGTSSGVTAEKAGKLMAEPMPRAKVSASKPQGPISPTAARRQSSRAEKHIQSCAPIRKRRRSRISASAPAGMASRKTGSRLAVCTRATMPGRPSRMVISQPAPVFCTHRPMLLNSVAVHSSRKFG
ncbi:hypothetical protein ROTAS13_03325 [Roseomonas sp. TAS13]|nr:hypothetical protein ROTAS13_03325 [Roseomonas sp. TAS13]